MNFKVISDSSCDLTNKYFEEVYKNKEIQLEVIPFVITVDGKEYVDDELCETQEMLDSLDDKKVKSYTSCPSPLRFEEACTADFNFIVTISSKLSGSFNSAISAANSLDKNIFVIDSKGTGGMEELIIDKLYELISEGHSYDLIKQKIIEYRDSLELYFTIASFDNLVKKGRIKAGLAKLIQAIKIKLLCKANDGEISLHKTCLSSKQTFINIASEAKRIITTKRKKCVINYVDNLDEANELKEKLEKTGLFEEVLLRKTRGLNSFYALKKGLICTF